MLYHKQEYPYFTDQNKMTAVSRYLSKLDRNNTRKLLPHECEFICSFLPSITKNLETREPAYDLYAYDFLSEAVFKKLILIYLGNLDFLMPVHIGSRDLEKHEIERDKRHFAQLLSSWEIKLSSQSDAYLHEVKLEHKRKLELLCKTFKANYFGRKIYERKIIEQTVNAFYIYFIVKSFFKNNKANFVSIEFNQVPIVINVYSYVHTISRHYMPMFNGMDPEKSFNGQLVEINPFELPTTLASFIHNYLNNAPEGYSITKEFIIFNQDNQFYILWWKYKSLSEFKGQKGYEVRTLYRIIAARDLEKIDHESCVIISDRISYYY